MIYNIAIGGIHIESTTFTSYISDEKDFKITRGEELIYSYPWLVKYKPEINFIPLINARAIPGGVVSKSFFEKWLNEYLSLLNENISNYQIDGLLLDLHGAMSVEGLTDAEGEILKRTRELIGDKVVISLTMDLHGNVSDLLYEKSDLLTCYRTAPHIDQTETKMRALKNLVSTITGEYERISSSKIDVPILLPGEKTSTEVEPGKGLYLKINEICKNDSIIDVSIWMGFPWADQPRCHSVIIVTGTNQEIVEQEARNLANHYWNIRNKFVFVGPVASSDEAINLALSSSASPYFISDTGDNPGAGGSGDINILLKKVIEINEQEKINKKVLFASIYDPKTITKIYERNIGSKIQLNIGGKIDKQFGGPLKLEVIIKYLFNDQIAGRCALVNNNNVNIIITEKRYQYGSKEAFLKASLNDFSDYDIIFVKMGYLEPDLSAAAKGWTMALSKGAVSQDQKNIDFKYLKRPLYPIDSFETDPVLISNTKVKKI